MDPDHDTDASQQELARSVLRRSVLTGALLAGGSLLLTAGYLAATPDGPHRRTLWLTFGIAGAVALVLVLLPWSALVRRRLVRPIVAVWFVALSATIAFACILDGGFRSPLQALFPLVLLFAATHLRPRVMRHLGVLVGAMIVATGAVTGTMTLPSTVLLLGVPALVLAVSTSMAETTYLQKASLRALARRLEVLASTDALTGCINHRSFHERIGRHLLDRARQSDDRRRSAPVNLLVLDVDHFKRVNDEHGHPVGDRVLATVAQSLLTTVRPTDTVGRTGGEEFTILLPGRSQDHAEVMAERIRTAVAEATRAMGVPVTVSGGLATVTAPDVSVERVVRRAGQALYAAKQQGRNRLVIAGEGGASGAEDPSASELDAVLAEGRIAAVYQPIATVDGHRPVAYEALGRIIGSKVTPDRWLEVAESAGRRAELEAAFWDAALAGWDHREDVSLFLNASPDALADPALLGRRHRLPPGTVVEVSERWAVTSYLDFARVLNGWAEHGVRIAIDDMGAGHANLRHVLELEPDFVKLDRSLVEGVHEHPRREKLVRALTGFAAAAGIQLIAEGVEEAAEVAVLEDAGVPLVQGYYLGRPGPLPARTAVEAQVVAAQIR